MMKSSKNIIWSFLLLVFIAALYRILPGRPLDLRPNGQCRVCRSRLKIKDGIYHTRIIDVCARSPVPGFISADDQYARIL